MSFRAKIMSITPIVCLAVYLTLGFVFGVWRATWLIFLLIPIMPYLLRYKKFRLSVPIVVVAGYIVLGLYGYWHPGWLILFLIPIIEILLKPSEKND